MTLVFINFVLVLLMVMLVMAVATFALISVNEYRMLKEEREREHDSRRET